MSESLLHRAGTLSRGGLVVDLTPEQAGWDLCGLQVLVLAPGQAHDLDTGPDEMVVLPLSGGCTVETGHSTFHLDGRPDVFSRVTDFAYLPLGTRARIRSESGGRFALPTARAGHRLEPTRVPAEQVRVEVRGAGASTRQVNNFCAPDAVGADKLVAVEVLTPGGNWSSYPPHKHDEDRPGEAVLEEIYYFETACGGRQGESRRVGEGFALHRVYTPDGSLDLTEEVRTGDVVLVPRGYHGPSVAAPGYDLYYLNVLAGPGQQRTMAFSDDPAHAWVREAWRDEPADPRVPMCTADGPVAPREERGCGPRGD